MKKVFLAIAILAVSCTVQAQISFGVHVNGIGAKTSSDSDDDADFDIERSFRFSWKQGVVVNVPITEQFSFMPQLNVLSKGGKVDISNFEGEFDFFTLDTIPFIADAKGKSTLTYLEIPLNFVYNTAGENGGFFAGIGPSVSIGLGGQTVSKAKAEVNGTEFPFLSSLLSSSSDVKFDGDDDPAEDDTDSHLNRFELGVNALVGYRFSNGLFIQANYNHGISNINPSDDVKTRHQYFGIGIGIFLGGNQ